jgi:hypothetical protein
MAWFDWCLAAKRRNRQLSLLVLFQPKSFREEEFYRRESNMGYPPFWF